VRESRKKFKLGVSGWILMFLIPLFTFFATIKISEQQVELNRLESQLRSKKVELSELQEIEARLDLMRNRLAKFDQKLSVLDSIPLNNTTWSEFLNQIANVAQKTKYVWITEAAREGTEKVAIKGYSVYRSKIPQFVNSLENARLKKVEVQEIREKKVYNFEVEIVISPKVYAANSTKTKR
jgi:Tfp pilus assembly protein PilN